MLIQGLLQLNPAIFAIFYHHTLGKTSAKKTDDQALSFILGTELFTALFFLTIYFLVNFLDATFEPDYNILMWVMGGIFALETLLVFFFYFKLGKKSKNTTKSFLPRPVAKGILHRISKTKNRTDTILLGFLAASTEIIFVLPLYIIIAIQIIHLASRFSSLFIIAYIVVTTLPLFGARMLFRTGHNLAEIERRRVKRKTLFRFLITISFAVLSTLTILAGVFL